MSDNLPIWAICYMAFYAVWAFFGSLDDLKNHRNWFLATGTILSSVIVFTMVIAYYNPQLSTFLGNGLIGIIAVGLILEFYSVKSELQSGLFKDGFEWIDAVSVSIWFVVITIAYVLGIRAWLTFNGT